MGFLFRLAFWLSIVLYNLPSQDTQPAASGPRRAVAIGWSTRAPATEPRAPCAQKRTGCNPDKTSQNTLRSSDLAPPWHAPSLARPRDGGDPDSHDTKRGQIKAQTNSNPIARLLSEGSKVVTSSWVWWHLQ